MKPAIEETLREAWFATSVVAGLWLACYVYEIGFLARFRVPPLLADIGFSRPLALIVIAGPLAAGLAAALLWPQRYLPSAFAGSGMGITGGAGYAAVWGLLALAIALWSTLIANPVPLLLATDIGVERNPLKLLLAFSLLAALALLFGKFVAAARRGDFMPVVRSSLLIALGLALAFGLGWSGAARKMENTNSFFYLSHRPDFVLIRLYDENAVFVRYDRSSRRFGEEYLVYRQDDPEQIYVTRRPPRQ